MGKELSAETILQEFYHRYGYDEAMPFSEFESRFGEKIFKRCKQEKKPTNEDKIRDMSREELAEFLAIFEAIAYVAGETGIGDTMGKEERLNWLQQPAEEATS